RWATIARRWLLAGATGAVLALLWAVVAVGLGYPGTLAAWAILGGEWGLIGGAALGGGLWLFGRVSRGARPSEGLFTALHMCAVVSLVVLAYRLWPFHWSFLPRPVDSGYPHTPNPWAVMIGCVTPAVGTLGGMLAAGALWGWPGRRRRTAGWKAGIAALTAAGAVYLGWPEWSPLFANTREFARGTACESNLKGLGLALSMYADQWDGKLPLGKTATDLVGVDHRTLRDMRAGRLPEYPPWGGLGGGPLDKIVRNVQMFVCPSDPACLDWRGLRMLDRFPEPGGSYAWNAKWAGKRLRDVPADAWFLRDREPWHNDGWYVVLGDGRVEWQRP
ncbi:MAG: DUF1559 domain-containing protein, partial [Armatimonadetes bacterium]|nr:DUF1559 domain-containing protein [Armatimonadota bacterium]